MCASFVARPVKSITTDAPLTSVDFFHDGACLAAGSATGIPQNILLFEAYVKCTFLFLIHVGG